MPHRVARSRVAVTRRAGEERARDAEFEQVVILAGFWDAHCDSLVDELAREDSAQFAIVDRPSVACDVERILVIRTWKGVHRESPVAVQVALLWRRHDECVEAIDGEQRAHRMNARSPVQAHGRQKRESDAKLVEQFATMSRERRIARSESSPRDHASR